MSKIYEALKKAEQDRERARTPSSAPPAAIPPEIDGTDPIEEEYRKLRASLVSIAVPAGLHTVLVTAPSHGEGVTTVAVGLASALGKERESRVLLVEGNWRTPCFRSILPIPAEPDESAGRGSPESLAIRLEELNFSVIPAGSAQATAIDLDMIDGLLSRLRSQFDFIVVDGPPVNSYADASVLATKVDGVILVVQADKTPVAKAENAKRQLAKVGARILGVVLNRRRSYIPAFLESLL